MSQNTASPIKVWNRANQTLETERVFGGAGVQFLYGTRPGQIVADTLLSNHLVSRAYGLFQSSRFSKSMIEPFVRDYDIPMSEFEAGPFKSFNDFFIRKFKPGARTITPDPTKLAAPAEGRYFAFENINLAQKFPVKGEDLTAEALLDDDNLAKDFEGGPCLLIRLCPVDYHRFHFPDTGRITDSYKVRGWLHSVNPLALQYRSDIFATNERHVSILETKHFGRLAYVEVGAMMVGLIQQTHDRGTPFERGQEKGYFLFGASTVIVFGQKDKWKPAADLLHHTHARTEVLVKLGDTVGYR